MQEQDSRGESAEGATLAGELDELDDAPVDALGPGTRIDRYVVLNRLGAGGMGIVLAAYDPQLDRRVALKLLRPRGGLDHAQARLQREAQALAKLDHPNVVSVHDVGVHGDRVFVAMDHVDGHTLTTWLRAAPRSWQAILAVFIEAGRGLAAAHAAGLVHRDFKPDNVMIDERSSRRVRVMDFGLARAESGRTTDDETRPTIDALVDRLTRTGALLGTPAYMALEQFEGREVDARSDQFAFCVALYEALYGQRPFAASELPQLIAALEAERIRESPPGSRVPAWLRRVLLRGLTREPDARWPSMQALLSALADDPAPRRRRWLGLALLSALLVAGTTLVVTQREAPSVCTGAEAKLAQAWDAERRARVEQAFAATELGYASDAWQRVEAGLDAYASAWVAAHTDACEATQAGEQSGELLDQRMACLAERRTSLAALVDELATADAAVVERGVAAMLDLPAIADCDDIERLRDEQATPELVPEHARLDERLRVARAKFAAGRFEDASALLDVLVDEAEARGDEPLLARAWLLQGRTSDALGRFDDASTQLDQALAAALAQRMHDVAASAAAHLVYVVGYRRNELERGHEWQRLSAALARASGSTQTLALHENNAGVLATAEGRWDAAAAHHERALALRRESIADDPLAVATSLGNLGNVALSRGDIAQATTYMAAALDLQIRTQGPEHPDVGSTLNNLGSLAAMQSDWDGARRHFEAALAIWERSLGPDHSDLAYPLGNLGALAKDQRRYADARAYLERALDIWQRSLGPDHPSVASMLDNLGSLAIAEGKPELACEHYEQALALRERAQGTVHVHVAFSLTGLGRAWLVRGEPQRARPLLERALALRTSGEVPDYQRGEVRFALARALAALPEPELARARELAEQARDDYLRYAAGEVGEEVEQIDAWLATLPP